MQCNEKFWKFWNSELISIPALPNSSHSHFSLQKLQEFSLSPNSHCRKWIWFHFSTHCRLGQVQEQEMRARSDTLLQVTFIEMPKFAKSDTPHDQGANPEQGVSRVSRAGVFDLILCPSISLRHSSLRILSVSLPYHNNFHTRQLIFYSPTRSICVENASN